MPLSGRALSIRAARPEEAGAITELALRSKGHWGYTAEFLEACRAELTIRPEACDGVRLFVAERDGGVVGMYQLLGDPPVGELGDVFVDPCAIGVGVGRQLLHHALAQARALGFERLTIDADPHAESFYLRMGAARVGEVPSGSIPGRLLPRLELQVG